MAHHNEQDNGCDSLHALSLSSQVWLLHGLIGSECGTLRLDNGRISFTTDEGRLVFDALLCELKAVTYPLLYCGAGVKFGVGTDKYRLSFIQPGNTAGGEEVDIMDARALGKMWRPILEWGANAK